MGRDTLNRVLFLDIDGPLIPGRAYGMTGQTKPIVTIFDPVGVSIINHACEKQGRKIVLHSSWIRTALLFGDLLGHDVKEWCIIQGIEEKHFHEDAYTDRDTSWRYDRVAKWLADHPEVDDYVIVDDEPYEPSTDGCPHPEGINKHVLLVDFQDGLLTWHSRRLEDGNWRHP